MHKKKYLLVVGGPTASGKTALAISLARKYTTEILSADSRQFFREMTIGTAKPTPAELEAVPHHFVGHLSIHQPYSVGDFERDALNKLNEIYQRKDIAILAGGSSLYIQALCFGLDHFPEVKESTRLQIEKEYQNKGLPFLQSEVLKLDPAYFERVDKKNPQRLIRALSIIRQTGQPFSSFLDHPKPKRPFTPVFLALQHPRTVLYGRINQRVDQMVQLGLEQEAQQLHPQQDLNALQTVGYQEWFHHFEGHSTASEAIEKIKQHTRNFAKRQLTWIRREGFWKHFPPNQSDTLLPAYLDTAITQGWHWQYDRETGQITLSSGSTIEGQAFFRFFGSGKKRIAYVSHLKGSPQALPWLIHEMSLRAESATVFVDSPHHQSDLFTRSGYQIHLHERPTPLPEAPNGTQLFIREPESFLRKQEK